MMLLGIILVFVDAQHDGQVFAFGRSRNDDFLGATGGDVIDCAFDGLALLVHAVFLDGEQTGRLDHDVDAQVLPRDGGRIGLLEDLDFLAIDQQAIISNFDGAVEATIVRVVFEQVSHGLRIADVVEGDHFQFIWIQIADGLEHLTTNPPKSINTNFYSHFKPPRLGYL